MKTLAFLTAVLLAASCGSEGKTLPQSYRHIEVPLLRLGSAAAHSRGRSLFLQHCAICHGTRADGHGIRRNLSSRPRNLTDRVFLERSTPQSLYYVIREGVPGTAMPAWKALDQEATWDLVAYLLSVKEPN